MKHTFKTMLAGLAGLVGLALVAPAPAFALGTYGTPITVGSGAMAVTCRPFTDSTTKYPGDGTHLFDCVTPAGGSEPTQLNDIQVRVNAINSGLSIPAYNNLKTVGVKYYYFKTRADMLTFYNGTTGLNNSTFMNATARCGHTGYTYNQTLHIALVVSAIFQNCTLTTTNIVSPNVADVTSHESGHAFDATLAVAAGQAGGNYLIRPSQSKAFRRLVSLPFNGASPSVRSDEVFLDMGSTQFQKPVPCLGVFSNVGENALELDLGLPTARSGPVCVYNSAGTAYVLDPAFNGMTVLQIVQKQFPYFVPASNNADAFAELFAQLFAINIGVGSGTSSSNALPQVNQMINNLHCANAVVQNYRSGASSPVPTGPIAAYCPATTYAVGNNEYNQQ